VEELRATLAHERRLREEREAAARGASDGRAELERAHAAADEAARAHAAANAAAEGARAQLAQTTHVIEALEDEAARAQSEILRLEAELTGAASERTRLEDALAEARARVDEARERDGRHEREMARLRRELDHTAAVGRERVAESAGLGAQLESPVSERTPVETQLDEARGEADGAPMQVVTVGAAPGGRPRPGSARLRVVVLDGDAAWESAGTAGNDIVVLAPGENLAARVTEIAPARVVVNLAARGALGALHSLRASGCTASFWGCVATPAADRGVAL